MRRLLSTLMILCLLNVSIYGAVAELAQTIPNHPQHTTITVAGAPTAPDTHPLTIIIAEPEDIPHTSPTLSEKAHSAFKHCFTTAMQHPISQAIFVLCASSIGACSFIYLLTATFSALMGLSISVMNAQLFGGMPLTFAEPDQCINPASIDRLTHDLAAYQHLTQGSLSLTEVVPLWLNNAQNLMAILGGVILQWRHNEPVSSERWTTFQSNASTALRALGFPYSFQNISCDVILGSDPASDQVVNCQHETLPEQFHHSDVTPGTHGKLWLIKWWRHVFGKDSFRFIHAELPSDQRYPQLDMSPDYGNVNSDMRTDSRRMLLQSNHPLSLPDAIKDWIENAQHWLDQAFDIANQLRHQKCPLPEETKELNNLTLRMFDAHQALMTNGTVRCDFDIANNSLQVTDCTPDATPTDYNHDARCDMSARLRFARDGALWFVPDNHALYKTFMMVARQFVTHTQTLPIILAPTTLEPTTPQPTTLEPTTAEPTTVEPTTPDPTTKVPVKNTTTRIYWSNSDTNEIWMADVNKSNYTALNPRIFLKHNFLSNIMSFCICKATNVLYWSDSSSNNIYWGFLNLTFSPSISSKGQVSARFDTSVKSLSLDSSQSILFIGTPKSLYKVLLNHSAPSSWTLSPIVGLHEDYYTGYMSSGLKNEEIYLIYYGVVFAGKLISSVENTTLSSSNVPLFQNGNGGYLQALNVDRTNSKVFFRPSGSRIILVCDAYNLTKINLITKTFFVNTSIIHDNGGLFLEYDN